MPFKSQAQRRKFAQRLKDFAAEQAEHLVDAGVAQRRRENLARAHR
jgi:hypothetical protein